MLRTIVTVAYIILCVVLSVLILMQEGKNRGLGAVSGQTTFWDKAKSRSKEGKLNRATYILSALFYILSVALLMHPFGK